MQEEINTFNEELLTSFLALNDERKIVYGYGNPRARLVLVGEAPGANEEKEGRPFVGAAGKMLDKFLALSGLERDELYITNVVKVRPTKLSPKTGGKINRPPNTDELSFFTPFLLKELDIIHPDVVVSLGNTPLRAISGKQLSISDVHGQSLHMPNFVHYCLYHPAATIYKSSLSEVYEVDVLKLRDIL